MVVGNVAIGKSVVGKKSRHLINKWIIKLLTTARRIGGNDDALLIPALVLFQLALGTVGVSVATANRLRSGFKRTSQMIADATSENRIALGSVQTGLISTVNCFAFVIVDR